MKITSYGLSNVGRKRQKNEDSILVDDYLSLYIVADGMGGHLGGEFASQMAIKVVREVFQTLESDPEATLVALDRCEINNAGDRLKYAIRVASVRVFEEACKNEELAGMGTTAVGITIEGGKAYVCNVGDSRGYLVQDGVITQVTNDHSLISEQLRAGILTEEGARTHRFKNIITRSVGFQKDVEPDLAVRNIKKGDLFLLCSDGLTNLVKNDDILEIILGRRDLKDACSTLIKTANERGGDDNISTVLVEAR